MRQQMPGFGHAWPPLLLVAVLLALAVLEHGLGAVPATLAGEARVVDGDTIRLAGQRVRLLGIDAPELDQTCTDAGGQNWPCGAAARTMMAGMLAKGAVDCASSGRDRYGRPLADCRVGSLDLGQAMVAAGLAIADGNYSKEQQEAQGAKLGIWAGSFMLPAEWRREHGEVAPPTPFGHLLHWLP
jgi:endonuclease YncB( thermonuclease family)